MCKIVLFKSLSLCKEQIFVFVDGAEAGVPSEEVTLASVCSHRCPRAVLQQLP